VARPVRLALIALAILVFLAISFQLARFFQAESSERGAVFTLVQAEGRGDARTIIDHLQGCAAKPACVALARRNARTLKRGGKVKILAYDSPTAYAVGSAQGLTRVAWEALDHGLPVVQCVLVHRTGTAFAGRQIHLVSLSAPISRTGDC
jgi:hypothetical protein